MSEGPRDTTEEHDGHDQARQYLNLTDTGNGPTHPNEEALLFSAFGPPDDDGVYGGGG